MFTRQLVNSLRLTVIHTQVFSNLNKFTQDPPNRFTNQQTSACVTTDYNWRTTTLNKPTQIHKTGPTK